MTADPRLRRSQFAGSVGATFAAASATATHSIVLTAVGDLLPAIAGQDEHRFSLTFTSPGAATEDLYALTCEGVADSSLLLQSVAAADGTTVLHAVVNSPA